MKRVYLVFCVVLVSIFSSTTFAETKLLVQQVTSDVYALVGELGNRSAENYGNNATFGVVITNKGVVLIDSGASYKGAKQIHQQIKKLTDLPVIIVINTGGQDHRWMGNDYFKKLGAKVIASQNAVIDQKARQKDELFRLESLTGAEALLSTELSYADETFEKQLSLNVGDTKIEITHTGQAHTLGDSFVWLPKQQVMFSGDIVYTERMLGVNDHSNSKSWITVFEAMASYEPKHLVPGHGRVTTMKKATADTYDFLVAARKGVADFIDDGGDMSDIKQVDLSKYNYLFNSDVLTGRNAQNIFVEMEWE